MALYNMGMPSGFDQIHLLAIKQAAQQQDPASAAMAAAAKQVPSATPFPALVPPAKPAEVTGEDTAKAEEAHRKELERKDKELNALRNNAQVLQMQLAHQKALAALDRHRDQIYKSIEKKEEDHRRYMEKEDAALQQRKERMQAEEIRHQAKMDVATANQHAQAAEDQAKLTAQQAQQSAREYVKMTTDARKATDAYFSQKSQAFDKQQKALDAKNNQLSPVVMNRLRSAIKATGSLGAIRSKLQGTPGIMASGTREELNKAASTPQQQYTPAQWAFHNAPYGQDVWQMTGNIDPAKLGWSPDAQAAWHRTAALHRNDAAPTPQQAARVASDYIGRDFAAASAASSRATAADDPGEELAGNTWVTQRAADLLRARQNRGETLTREEQMDLDSFQAAANSLERYYKAVAAHPQASPADVAEAKRELAVLKAYKYKHPDTFANHIRHLIGKITGDENAGMTSVQDKVLNEGATPKSFWNALADGNLTSYGANQLDRAIEAKNRGDHFTAVRRGAKAAVTGVPGFLFDGLLQGVNSIGYYHPFMDFSGNRARAQQIASDLGTKLTFTGIEGAPEDVKNTELALRQAGLPASRIGVKLQDARTAAPATFEAVASVAGLPWVGKAWRFAAGPGGKLLKYAPKPVRDSVAGAASYAAGKVAPYVNRGMSYIGQHTPAWAHTAFNGASNATAGAWRTAANAANRLDNALYGTWRRGTVTLLAPYAAEEVNEDLPNSQGSRSGQYDSLVFSGNRNLLDPNKNWYVNTTGVPSAQSTAQQAARYARNKYLSAPAANAASGTMRKQGGATAAQPLPYTNAAGGYANTGGTQPRNMADVNDGYQYDEYGNARRRLGSDGTLRTILRTVTPFLSMAGLNADQSSKSYPGYRVPIMLDRISTAAYNSRAARQAANPYGLTEEGQAMYAANAPQSNLASRLGINPSATGTNI